MILWGYGVQPNTTSCSNNGHGPTAISSSQLALNHAGLIAAGACSEMQFSQVLLSCGSGATAARALNSVLENLDGHAASIESALPALQSSCGPFLPTASLSQFNISQLQQLQQLQQLNAQSGNAFQQLHPILLPSAEQWADSEARCKPLVCFDFFKANAEHLVGASGGDALQAQAIQTQKRSAMFANSDVLEQLQLANHIINNQSTPILGVNCSEGQVPTLGQHVPSSQCFSSLESPSQVVPSDSLQGNAAAHSPFAQTSVASPQLAGTPSPIPGTPQPAGYENAPENTVCLKGSLCPASRSICCSQQVVRSHGQLQSGCVALRGSFCCEDIQCSEKSCSSIECGLTNVAPAVNPTPTNFSIAVSPQTPSVTFGGNFVQSNSPQNGFLASSASSSPMNLRSVCGTPTPSIASTCSELSTRSRAGSISASRSEGLEEKKQAFEHRFDPESPKDNSSNISKKKKSKSVSVSELSPEELKDKRSRQAQKARMARKKETPEKRKRRLAKLAAYAAERRRNESEEERERRLQDMRERQKKRVQQKKKLQQQIGGRLNRSSDTDDSQRCQKPSEDFALEDAAAGRKIPGSESADKKTHSPVEREMPARTSSVSSTPAASPPLVVPSLQQLVTVLAGGVGAVGGVDPAFTVTQVVAQVAPGSTTLSTRVARLRPILPKPQETAQTAGETKTKALGLKDIGPAARSPGRTAETTLMPPMGNPQQPHLGYPTPSTLSSCSSPAHSQLSDFDIPSPLSISDRSTPLEFSPTGAHDLDSPRSACGAAKRSLPRPQRTNESAVTHKDCLVPRDADFPPSRSKTTFMQVDFQQSQNASSEFLTAPSTAEFPIESAPTASSQQHRAPSDDHVNLDELGYTPLREVMSPSDAEATVRCLREGLQTPPPSDCNEDTQQLPPSQILSSHHSHSVHSLNFQPTSGQMDPAPGFESLLCPTPGLADHHGSALPAHHDSHQSQDQANILQNAIFLSQLNMPSEYGN
ncbi:uncharacterized protein LOC114828299 [Galendromus occidentalis]|uniref:Uncharacterized protein LOC114828299 n=1 Tax=Galendromus occidentalis TaxID=34638 RepID=A0AAJ7SFJ9_9ACAR|nr:uncharacterized protein LOC114828299 [Galendromus occidentalis]